MQRLGKNVGAYLGETIEIASVIKDCVAIARRHGWTSEEISATSEIILQALRRVPTKFPSNESKRIYISAGIHGDEPAGPLAVRRLLEDNTWPTDTEVWLCPCLNPTGFPLNRRENAQGKDLNRDYFHLETPEIRAHTQWLKRQPTFDATFCLHEDWESHGFYLYELNPDNGHTFAPAILEAVSKVCPIDFSEVIEDRPAQRGLINPSVDPASRPQWPEAFFLLQNKTRMCYTLEAPSDFPLQIRVDALVAALRAVFKPISPV